MVQKPLLFPCLVLLKIEIMEKQLECDFSKLLIYSQELYQFPLLSADFIIICEMNFHLSPFQIQPRQLVHLTSYNEVSCKLGKLMSFLAVFIYRLLYT